jgi:pyrroline-5-carboxylate reductase
MSITIGFIGAGNMAGALSGGLLARGQDPAGLFMSDANESQLQAFHDRGIRTTTDNLELARCAEVLVLAVKPQVMRDVLKPLAALVQERKPLIISIAAGIPAASIERWLGGGVAVVRAMPNTPALVQTGATGLFANATVTDAQMKIAESILGAVGLTVRVEDEALIDSVTAVSGSGPAYFFYVMESMIAAGVAQGLDERTARALTLQTALGAAQMAITADVGPDELRRRVTSPGGTTERAIAAFDAAGLRETFAKALGDCAARGRELAAQLGGGD